MGSLFSDMEVDISSRLYEDYRKLYHRKEEP